jgi:hypothetical protein
MKDNEELRYLHSLVSSLSFDNYVLIDCLRTNTSSFVIYGYYSRSLTLNFIALNKQGFLNIFDEITKAFSEDYTVQIFDDRIIIIKEHILVKLKYTVSNINYLINLPGLDFYKCYYDGVKIHTTPEAIKCHKTKNVQYTGKISMISEANSIRDITCYYRLNFKEEFWNSNKHNINLTIMYDHYYVVQKKEVFLCMIHIHKVNSMSTEEYERKVLKYIKDVIFKKPVNSLS